MRKIIFWGSLLLVTLISCNKTYKSKDLIFKEGLAYLPKDSILFSGHLIDKHDNGNVKVECNYVNGGIHGVYKSFHENGALYEYAVYDSGVALVDSFKSFFDDGSRMLSEREALAIITSLPDEQVINSIVIPSYYAHTEFRVGEYLKWEPIKKFINSGILNTQFSYKNNQKCVFFSFTPKAESCIIKKYDEIKKGSYYKEYIATYDVLYGTFTFNELKNIFQAKGETNAEIQYDVRFNETIFNKSKIETGYMFSYGKKKFYKYKNGEIQQRKIILRLNQDDQWTIK